MILEYTLTKKKLFSWSVNKSFKFGVGFKSLLALDTFCSTSILHLEKCSVHLEKWCNTCISNT